MDQTTATNESNVRTYRDEVCANIQKIYDTCKDKDCLADMRVYFSPESQCIIDSAINVRAKCAKICYALVDLDPVPFNRGYYSVNIHFFFGVDFEVHTGCGRPQGVSGICSFEKKVILYGGEGNTMTYTSAETACHNENRTLNIPIAQVEVVDPIVLSSKTMTPNNCCCCCETDITSLPDAVGNIMGQEYSEGGEKIVTVSLGLFSIVRIVRDVQVMLPSARFCLPEKRCQCPTEEEPSTFFEKLSFPTGEFFPQDIGIDVSGGCSCNQ